jgi:alkylation response protein AidB-like acyl-CoA dehydrogenase
VDFGFNEEQEQLRAIVRDYLNAETPVTYARAMMDDERGYTDAAWQSMAELGWLGLSVPERFGGSGLGCLETALVAEAMGTVVLPGPWFATVAMGLAAWQAAADEAQSAQVLPEVARGEHRLALAVAEGRGSWVRR